MRTRMRMPIDITIGVRVDKTKTMDYLPNKIHVTPYYPQDSILYESPFNMYLANDYETRYTKDKKEALKWAFEKLGGTQERLDELLNAIKPKPQKTTTTLERLKYLIFHKKCK